MPKFNYVAMDSRGKETKGTLDVSNQNEAIARLKEMGFFPTKVVESEKAKPAKAEKKAKSARPGGKRGSLDLQIKIPGLSGRVKPKILTAFTRPGHDR
jgi:type II secretory pathway component PulF